MIKKFLIGIALALSFAAHSAQTIEIVVPISPGGAIDMTARAMSQALTDSGFTNIVTYHPGANGDIALKYVREKKDNVILAGSSATFIFSHVINNRDNIHVQEMQLFGPTVTNAMGFVVGTNSRFKNIRDMITEAKQQDLPCAVSNSHGEIEIRRINHLYGTKFVAIPYAGSSKALPDIIGGHVPCGYDQTAAYVSAGDKIRWLATSQEVWPDTPALSTVLPKFQFETWYAAAIPNDSNLLTNRSLINIISNWSANPNISESLIGRGFQRSPPKSRLNKDAQNETQMYKDLFNNKK